jgi:hypothetical protein
MSKRHQGRYTSFDSGRQREAEHMQAQQHMFMALHAHRHDDSPRMEARVAAVLAAVGVERLEDTIELVKSNAMKSGAGVPSRWAAFRTGTPSLDIPFVGRQPTYP